MITDYLLKLLDELHVPTRRRRRILIEVEDHLACASADLHADGLDAEDAEREAVRRFGPAAELARSFAEQEAAIGGRRVARASGVLAAMLALIGLGPLGRLLLPGSFPAGLVEFVLAQVALVAGALTLARARRAAPDGGLHGPRLALVLRGAVVVVACAAATLAYGAVDAVAQVASGGSAWLSAAWPALAGGMVGVAATAATLSRSWRLASAAAITGPAPSPSDSASGSPVLAAASSDPDVLDDLQAAAVLALARLQRRVPALRGLLSRVARLVQTLPAELPRRAPRLAPWLDLRAHPWRFAVSVASSAGLALSGGRILTEGLPTGHHVFGGLIAVGLIAGIEAFAALLGFAALGRFLGIRPTRTRN